MKTGLFPEAIKNLLTPKRSPVESIEVLNSRRQKMPLAGIDCNDCGKCSEICPAHAIGMTEEGWSVDIGKCIFCWECKLSCEKGAIRLAEAPDYVLKRDDLIFRRDEPPIRDPGKLEAEKLDVIGRSIQIREVDVGSCNACEVEVNSLSNQFYDVERFGIKIVASPRHADVLLITGPLTENMYEALTKVVAATPDPKVIIAMGTCAISGGLFAEGNVVGTGIGDTVKVDIYVPGCPPSPDRLMRSMLSAFGLGVTER